MVWGCQSKHARFDVALGGSCLADAASPPYPHHLVAHPQKYSPLDFLRLLKQGSTERPSLPFIPSEYVQRRSREHQSLHNFLASVGPACFHKHASPLGFGEESHIRLLDSVPPPNQLIRFRRVWGMCIETGSAEPPVEAVAECVVHRMTFGLLKGS